MAEFFHQNFSVGRSHPEIKRALHQDFYGFSWCHGVLYPYEDYDIFAFISISPFSVLFYRHGVDYSLLVPDYGCHIFA